MRKKLTKAATVLGVATLAAGIAVAAASTADAATHQSTQSVRLCNWTTTKTSFQYEATTNPPHWGKSNVSAHQCSTVHANIPYFVFAQFANGITSNQANATTKCTAVFRNSSNQYQLAAC